VAFDQTIRYKVNVDDADFQAKLTQMRASLDSSMGGGGPGFSAPMMYGMMGAMYGTGQGGIGAFSGGVADFGTQIRPVTYTPPAIAMQPHFGMFQVQQSLTQAGLASFGPWGVATGGAWTNFRQGGIGNVLSGPSAVPGNIGIGEYMAMSARGMGDRVGDTVAMGAMTAASTIAQIAAGGIGEKLGRGLIGGGVGGFIGGMALPMAVSSYASAAVDIAAENRAIQSSLAAGSFRFFTGSGGEVDPLTGRGMSRRARADVATSVQHMALEDLRYGSGDYRQILEGGMQFDLFTGTRDVEDFKSKFKGIVESLKTVTTTLHTSLKEGLEVMRGFRDMGVTDSSDITRLTLASEARGRMSGRTGMEMMALGQAGAEMFRGTGINMERGFELAQENAVTVNQLLKQGLISQQTIGQAGGANALAQQMTAGALSAFQSVQGRAVMAANFNPSTGGLNPNMIQGLASGGLMGSVANASSMGPAALMRFQAHQEEIIGNMSPGQMAMFGLGLDIGVARHLQQMAPGLSMDDAIRNAGMTRGLSKAQLDVEIATLHQDPAKMKADQMQALDAVKNQAATQDVYNRFNVLKRAHNAWTANVTQPAGDALTEISTGYGESWENFSMGLSGVNRLSNHATSQTLIESARASGVGGGGLVEVGGSGYQRLVGGQTGQPLIDAISGEGRRNPDGTVTYRGATAFVFDKRQDAVDFQQKTQNKLNIGTDAHGKTIAYTDDFVTNAAKHTREWQSTADERAAAEKKGLGKDTVMSLMRSKDSAEDVLQALGVSPTIMGLDAEAFKKATGGRTKGEVSAQAELAMKTYGARFPEASKRLKEIQSTGILSDSASAGAAYSSRQTDEALNKLYDQAYAGAAYDDVGALATHKDILPYLADPKHSQEEKLAYGLEKTGKDLSKTIQIFNERPADAGTLAKAYSGALQIESARESTGGAAGAAGGKVIGDVSKETVELINKQAAELKRNYEELIRMQKELNALQGGTH
jgi:hypothetical protein